MEMFFLIVFMYPNHSVVIPEKYTKDACEEAGKSTLPSQYRCVPAPINKAEYCKFHYEVVSDGYYNIAKKVCD